MIHPQQIKKTYWKLFVLYQLYSATATPALIYLTIVIMGLSADKAVRSAMFLFPPLMTIVGVVGPYLVISLSTKQALRVDPSEPPGARLARILKLPRKIEIGLMLVASLGVGLYVAIPAIYYKTSLWTIPWGITAVIMLQLLIMIQIRLSFEKVLRPFAIEEFHQKPDMTLTGGGLLWPRQGWYLPYAFAVFVSCTLTVTLTVIGRSVYSSFVSLEMQASQMTGSNISVLIRETVSALLDSSVLPLALLGTYLLINAGLSAWRMAQHQTDGARSVQGAMEALASGKPKLPEWVSTDEIGDLAVATARVFEQLKSFSSSLGESARSLQQSAQDLGLSTSKQTEVLTLQATALQETQVTAQEIKQTSTLASQKAEGILQQAERADEISRAGETAIQKSLSGLQEIGEQVREMATRIKSLEDRTRQIANITGTVKDLADQSNMLALNAAIEAVRSGEHGKGFGVVAREIRALADQSIQATNSVRDLLQDIVTAIQTTVAITEKGSEKVEASLSQVRAFGDNIQQLSKIVRDNAASVRQITAAVTQQNAGIGQIFQAVSDLSKIMDQTMSQLRASDNAATAVRSVVEKVSSFVGNYGWKEGELQEQSGGGSSSMGTNA